MGGIEGMIDESISTIYHNQVSFARRSKIDRIN